MLLRVCAAVLVAHALTAPAEARIGRRKYVESVDDGEQYGMPDVKRGVPGTAKAPPAMLRMEADQMAHAAGDDPALNARAQAAKQAAEVIAAAAPAEPPSDSGAVMPNNLKYNSVLEEANRPRIVAPAAPGSGALVEPAFGSGSGAALEPPGAAPWQGQAPAQPAPGAPPGAAASPPGDPAQQRAAMVAAIEPRVEGLAERQLSDPSSIMHPHHRGPASPYGRSSAAGSTAEGTSSSGTWVDAAGLVHGPEGVAPLIRTPEPTVVRTVEVEPSPVPLAGQEGGEMQEG